MTKTDIKIKENPRDRQNGLDDYYMHIFLLVCDLNNLQKTRPTDRQKYRTARRQKDRPTADSRQKGRQTERQNDNRQQTEMQPNRHKD